MVTAIQEILQYLLSSIQKPLSHCCPVELIFIVFVVLYLHFEF